MVYDKDRDSESFELQIVARLTLRKILNNTICDSPSGEVAFFTKYDSKIQKGSKGYKPTLK